MRTLLESIYHGNYERPLVRTPAYEAASRAVEQAWGAAKAKLSREELDELWTSQSRDTASYGANTGFYVGLDSVRRWYVSAAATGDGVLFQHPISTGLVELAGDGQTAKGLWFCQGAYNDVETSGPVAHWTWGYFAADFVREGEGWKIWHLQYLNDVDCICGQSWAGEQKPYPDLPEFAPLADFRYPEYSVSKQFRALYSADRPATLCPEIPQPYATFAETFSYGV